MRARSFFLVSVGASALLGAAPAHSQPAASQVEAELIDTHQACDGGDRQACIQFGFILGENQAYWGEWRQLHPDWWAWQAPAAAPVADITMAPPELPVYEQPPIPEPGYIWTPGYWAWGAEGYYWVPGTWILPPAVGLLWTPGYWGWRGGVYVWKAGYWGPHIGFYGGINYGFGYGGVGYEGGRWNGGVFLYNRTVNNFGAVRITNVYSETVVVRSDVRVSFNGGSGGIEARPTPQEEAAAHERHTPPTAEQSHQQQAASINRSLLASENHGQPAIAATAKPGEFSGKGVVAAREAPHSGVPAGGPPTGARPMEPGPSGAKPMEPNPNEARKPLPGPNEANKSEPNPNELRKSLPGPSEAIKPPVNPNATKPPEKGVGERANLNNGAPPQPHMATAPHPVTAPHPPAKPTPPAKDNKKQPG